MIGRFRIELTRRSTPYLVHRLRNLGEDLHRFLGDKAHIDMQEVDPATQLFWVDVSDRRNLGVILFRNGLERATLRIEIGKRLLQSASTAS